MTEATGRLEVHAADPSALCEGELGCAEVPCLTVVLLTGTPWSSGYTLCQAHASMLADEVATFDPGRAREFLDP